MPVLSVNIIMRGVPKKEKKSTEGFAKKIYVFDKTRRKNCNKINDVQKISVAPDQRFNKRFS